MKVISVTLCDWSGKNKKEIKFQNNEEYNKFIEQYDENLLDRMLEYDPKYSIETKTKDINIILNSKFNKRTLEQVAFMPDNQIHLLAFLEKYEEALN